jgi:hypothetical protein
MEITSRWGSLARSCRGGDLGSNDGLSQHSVERFGYQLL